MRSLEFVVSGEDEGKRMDQFLTSKLKGEVSRTEIQKILKSQGALLNGASVKKTNVVLKADDRLLIELGETRRAGPGGEKLPIRVVFEDADLLVVDKAAGMVVHPSPGHRKGTLVNALLGSGRELSDWGGKERPGIVHRLDKGTSGLMIVAKNNKAHRRLTRMLQERTIRKIYNAVVSGRVEFEEGQIEDPIGRDPKNRLKMAVRPEGVGRDAFTEYRVLERMRYATFLEVRILTGRTHQIRVHFAHRGHPVLGDTLYGDEKTSERLALHAAKLEFDHPTSGKPLRLESELPRDFIKMLEAEKAR